MPTQVEPPPESDLGTVDYALTLQNLCGFWKEGHIDESQPLEACFDSPIEHTHLCPTSIFYPLQSKGPYIDTYYQVVYRDLIHMCESQPRLKRNLTYAKHQALRSLENLPSITIKQADKSGSLVIQDHKRLS